MLNFNKKYNKNVYIENIVKIVLKNGFVYKFSKIFKIFLKNQEF